MQCPHLRALPIRFLSFFIQFKFLRHPLRRVFFVWGLEPRNISSCGAFSSSSCAGAASYDAAFTLASNYAQFGMDNFCSTQVNCFWTSFKTSFKTNVFVQTEAFFDCDAANKILNGSGSVALVEGCLEVGLSKWITDTRASEPDIPHNHMIGLLRTPKTTNFTVDKDDRMGTFLSVKEFRIPW